MSFKTVTNKYGRTYEINESDGFWIKSLSSGIFQVNNLRKLYELKPNARTILDIGANIGSNTIEYSTWAKQVYSFEPTPELFTQLVKNISLNKNNPDTVRWCDTLSMKCTANIVPIQKAVGDKLSSVFMKTHNNNKGKNYVTNNKTNADIEVEVITIDSMNFTEVDVMKIDVEGYEPFVLQGAEQTILRDRPVIQTEISPEYLKRNGYTVQQLAEWFYEREYYAIDRHGNKQSEQFPVGYEGKDFFWIHIDDNTVDGVQKSELFNFE
jgi:FkbM family methyltransferase